MKKAEKKTNNYEIRELKKAMGVKWADVIKHTGLSESYFYNLLDSEMSGDYERLVREAINKAHSEKVHSEKVHSNSDAEKPKPEPKPEKIFRDLFNKTKKMLDTETKLQMILELCTVVEKYQAQAQANRPRFDISKNRVGKSVLVQQIAINNTKEGEDV